MSQPVFLRTNVYEIYLALKARLVAWKVVSDPSVVKLCVRREIPHFKGKQDIVFKPRKEFQIQARAEGGGPYDIVCIRNLDVFVRTSYAGNEVSDDAAWLEQHVPLEDAVLDATITRMLQDNSNPPNEYLTQPMKFQALSDEEKEKLQGGTSNLWGSSAFSIQCFFIPNIDPTKVT